MPVASPLGPGILALPRARGMQGKPAKGLCTEDQTQGIPGQWAPQDYHENGDLRIVQCTTYTPTVVALRGPRADLRADGLRDPLEP